MAKVWSIAVLGVFALTQAAHAEDAPEPEIVVTAPIEGARIESLQGVEVMTRDEILQNLNGGLGETLEQAPGVTSTFFGAGASRPVIRGLGDDRVRVLENGIGAIDAASASPDHAVTADGLDASRIEILRGGAALAYGGNAVGGVVNVVDDSIPRAAPEAPVSGDGVAGLSSVDDGRQGAVGATFGLGSFAFRLDVAARDTDDYEIPGFARSARLRADEPLDPGLSEAEGAAPNSFTKVRSYTGGGALVGDWGFAGLAVKRYETEYGLPPEEAGSTLGGHIELEQTRIETRGDVKLDAGPFTRFDWAAQSSDYQHTEFEDTGEAGTNFTNEGYEARLEIHNGAGDDKLKGALGLQVNDTDFKAIGDEKFIDPTATSDVGVFVVERWDEGGYGFEGGARYERRDLDNTPDGAATRSLDFSAVSLSLGAFVRPADNWFVGATVARTERAPTGPELFAEGAHLATGAFERGDASLDIETATSLEGSARYNTGALTFEANLYRIEFDGYIALVPTDLEFNLTTETEQPVGAGPDTDEILPIFQFVQRDANFTGGELALSGDFAKLGAWTFRGDAALDWVRAEFDAGGDIPRIPPRSATLGLEANSDALSFRVEAVDYAAQSRTAAFETPTEGSTLVNARAVWRPLAGDSGVSIILDGRNLTDEESRVHASFLKDELPRPGRNIRLLLRASF